MERLSQMQSHIALSEGGRERAHTHRGKGNVQTEAEIGMMQAQGKECQQSPEPGKGKGETDSLLEPPEGAQPRQHLDSASWC